MSSITQQININNNNNNNNGNNNNNNNNSNNYNNNYNKRRNILIGTKHCMTTTVVHTDIAIDEICIL